MRSTLTRTKALGYLLLLVPAVVFGGRRDIGDGGVLPFPPESCQSVWQQAEPQAYLYDFSRDNGYPTYLQKLKSQGMDRKGCHKNWTVLIYMSATSELVPYAYADLLEMEAALNSLNSPHSNNKTGSSIRTDVIVQLSVETQPWIQRLHMFESPVNQVQNLKKENLPGLKATQIRSPSIMTLQRPIPATGSKLLEDFLKWGIEEYPSEHYFVIIWGHGQGWGGISANTGNSRSNHTRVNRNFEGRYGGIALESNSDYIDIPVLKSVLRNVKQWSGDAVDVFASDACLMQTVEDVAELADNAHYISGSEDIESYAGFPYGHVLCQLNSGNFNGAATRASHSEKAQGEPFLVSWMIPQLYKESFDPNKGSQWELDPQAHSDLTGCTISTKHLRTTLIPELNRLGNSLIEYMQENKIRWIDLKDLIQRGPFFQGGTQDLGAFLKNLHDMVAHEADTQGTGSSAATQKLLNSIRKTYLALKYTVVNAVLGEGYPKFDPNQSLGPMGLSIWIPKSDEEFQERIDDFSKAYFYGARGQIPGWARWMSKMYRSKK